MLSLKGYATGLQRKVKGKIIAEDKTKKEISHEIPFLSRGNWTII